MWSYFVEETDPGKTTDLGQATTTLPVHDFTRVRTRGRSGDKRVTIALSMSIKNNFIPDYYGVPS